jgi:hypothetical protein
MTKPTITKIWLGGLVAIAVGLVVGGIGVGLMLAYGGTFTPAVNGSGYDFVPQLDGFFWMAVMLIVIGGSVAAAGGIAQLAALIGALVNTYQLQDRTWFVVLAAGGLIGLAFGLVGFAAMLAYVIAGPDALVSATAPPARPPAPPAPPAPPMPPRATDAFSDRPGVLVPTR